MGTWATLPNEIKMEILQYTSATELAVLAATCHALRAPAEARLYRRPVFRREIQVVRFLKTLEMRPDLSSYVQVIVWNCPSGFAPNRFHTMETSFALHGFTARTVRDLLQRTAAFRFVTTADFTFNMGAMSALRMILPTLDESRFHRFYFRAPDVTESDVWARCLEYLGDHIYGLTHLIIDAPLLKMLDFETYSLDSYSALTHIRVPWSLFHQHHQDDWNVITDLIPRLPPTLIHCEMHIYDEDPVGLKRALAIPNFYTSLTESIASLTTFWIVLHSKVPEPSHPVKAAFTDSPVQLFRFGSLEHLKAASPW